MLQTYTLYNLHMKTRAFFFSFILAGALVVGACGKKAEEPATDSTAVENKMDSAAPAATTSETTTPPASNMATDSSAAPAAAGDATKMADSASGAAATDTAKH